MLARIVAAFAVVTAVAWIVLSFVWPRTPIDINVRWKQELDDAQRLELERRFQLMAGRQAEGTTWQYQLTDPSTANIRALVQSEQVDDTAHVDRARFRPEEAQDRSRNIRIYSLGAGTIGAALLLLIGARSRPARVLHVRSRTEFLAAVRSALVPTGTMAASGHRALTSREIAALVASAGAAHVAMWLAGAPLLNAAVALIVLYGFGYVAGFLLVSRSEGIAWPIVRTVSGLLLTTIAFLLSLVLSLPWFAGPVALVAAASLWSGRKGWRVPRAAAPPAMERRGWDRFVAMALAIVLVLPVAITFVYMAPGDFPPVFYNIDTAYFLEKVHALTATDTYPPASLSNVGVQRTYHYGTHAMAALIARSTGLASHQALFVVLLPLLTAGVLAAAFAAAREISPHVPRSVAVPLLLLAIPSLTHSLWQQFAAQLWAGTVDGFSLNTILGDYGLWGFLSNEGQNVGGDFVIIGTIAGIAAAPSQGWRLPAFLIGTAILVKSPVGVALVAGFALAEVWRAVAEKRLVPAAEVVIAATVFVVVFVAFFWLSFASEYRVAMFPLAHLRELARNSQLAGVLVDILFLLLPVLIVATAAVHELRGRGVYFLAMALAPLLVVNVSRLDNVTTGAGGAGGDWTQMLHPVPFLVHAGALMLAGSCWTRLGRSRRAAFLLMAAIAILPVCVAAARYSIELLRDPRSGHEFVDNRAIAEALARIPTSGSIVVTNDLRYPAEQFSRGNRQAQIPAVFGHQAFAVNYAYEVVGEERRGLQKLLEQQEWAGEILAAAQTHHWTHLLIRKDYPHPTPIPLERIFDNDEYAVYRFP